MVVSLQDGPNDPCLLVCTALCSHLLHCDGAVLCAYQNTVEAMVCHFQDWVIKDTAVSVLLTLPLSLSF